MFQTHVGWRDYKTEEVVACTALAAASSPVGVVTGAIAGHGVATVVSSVTPKCKGKRVVNVVLALHSERVWKELNLHSMYPFFVTTFGDIAPSQSRLLVLLVHLDHQTWLYFTSLCVWISAGCTWRCFSWYLRLWEGTSSKALSLRLKANGNVCVPLHAIWLTGVLTMIHVLLDR